MFTKITSGAVLSFDGYPVTVEVDVSTGLPCFDIVGLPDAAVKESRERVRTGIRNAGFSFPVKQITVNLAPAHLRKSGPSFDLPIAVGILVCSHIIDESLIQDAFFAGELSLDGEIRPVGGILPMLLSAKQAGVCRAYVPAENAAEAALVEGMSIVPLSHLTDLTRDTPIEPICGDLSALLAQPVVYDVDFADVQGQETVKRGLEIAAAGYHNVLMIGPPGAGKTMLARRLPTILPPLQPDESIEITKLYSIAGLLDTKSSLITHRPFRAPHHTSSYAALTGGGHKTTPKPGEISLAHNGILFLDELPEFQKRVLETLRQPLEDGFVTISRANGNCVYPCHFLFMAAMNPCPCGYLGSERCRCKVNDIAGYRRTVSGPLLDRIDMHIEVDAVPHFHLDTAEESSAAIKARVMAAHQLQQARFVGTKVRFNAQMTAPMVNEHCALGSVEKQFLEQAFSRMKPSKRASHKILKIARTIADLAGASDIGIQHLAEAVAYRELDRKYV